MYIALVPGRSGDGWYLRLDGEGDPVGTAHHTDDLAARIRERDHHGTTPRWVLAETRRVYPPLLAAGARLDRCHDVTLAEAILLSAEGHAGRPHHPAAAHARLHGLPVPDPEPVHVDDGALFDTRPPADPRRTLDMLVEVHRDQLRRTRSHGPRLALLTAAESAGALVAAEMTHHGLPWRTDVHDAVLTELVGPRPVKGLRPKRLQALADRIGDAFGHHVNPDSPQQVVEAFHAAGHPVDTTRAWELRRVDHPAVAPLLTYKELSRVYTAHGWNWLRDWVSDGPAGPASPAKRFRPEYVVGGVVTGRWATDGGGALQIPKAVRSACHADPGWSLVVADAAQLEPRVLAAMSRDDAMAAAAGSDDLYAALAPTFGGSRQDAKIALLSAMYGGTAGNATALLTVLRRRFPLAHRYVETAARTGETGGLVYTWLGRGCPPPSHRWWSARTESTRAGRDRGRFTRNFVVQGTAAEWAMAMMALLRTGLHDESLGELVFFQHDEIIVHCRTENAPAVVELIQPCADAATRLLFGDTPVRIPLNAKTVQNYAEAKLPSPGATTHTSRRGVTRGSVANLACDSTSNRSPP